MNAVQVDMHEAKSQLSALVERVLAGEEVTIARAGRPEVVIGLGRPAATPPPQVFDGPDADIVIKHMLGRRELPGGEVFPEIFVQAGLRELRLSSDTVLLGLGRSWILDARR